MPKNKALLLALLVLASNAFSKQTTLPELGLRDLSRQGYAVKQLDDVYVEEANLKAKCMPDSSFQRIIDKSGRDYQLHREWSALMDEWHGLATRSHQWARMMYGNIQIQGNLPRAGGGPQGAPALRSGGNRATSADSPDSSKAIFNNESPNIARLQADLDHNFSILDQLEANLASEGYALQVRWLDLNKRIVSEILKNRLDSEVFSLMLQYALFGMDNFTCFNERKVGFDLLVKLIGWTYLKDSLGLDYVKERSSGIKGRSSMDALKNEFQLKKDDLDRLEDQAFTTSLKHLRSMLFQKLKDTKSDQEVEKSISELLGSGNSKMSYLARRDPEIRQALKVRREELALARTQLAKAEEEALTAAAQARSQRAMEEHMARVAENQRRIASAIKNNSTPEVHDIEYAVTSASMELSERAQGLRSVRTASDSYTIDKFGREGSVVKRDVRINVKDINCKRVDAGHFCKYLESVDYRLYIAMLAAREPIRGALSVGSYFERIGIFKWGPDGLEVVRGKTGPEIGFLDLVSADVMVEYRYEKRGVTTYQERPETRITSRIGEGRLSN